MKDICIWYMDKSGCWLKNEAKLKEEKNSRQRMTIALVLDPMVEKWEH